MRNMLPLVALSLLAACAPEAQEPTVTAVETSDTDVLPEPSGEITVIPVAAFMPPQVVLDEHPSRVGEEETFTADAIVANDVSYVADGLVYTVTPDIDGVVAADFIHWCMLSEIRGGGDLPSDVVPVDIADEIEGNEVHFDYAFSGDRSFVLSCSFGRTEEMVGFNATLVEIVNPALVPVGTVEVTYTGTNTGDVNRTVYLTP